MSTAKLSCLILLLSVALISCTTAPAPETPVLTRAAVQPSDTAPPLTEVPVATATREPATATRELATNTAMPPSVTPMPPTAVAPTSALSATIAPTSTPLPPTETAMPPTETPIPPTATPPPPTNTPEPTLPAVPDPATGKLLWPDSPCAGCHGSAAQGDYGPKIAGTGLSFDQVLARVRLGKGQMPAFAENQIGDLALQHIYAWLRSLARPTPTPIARPNFPTQALTEMWYFVNEMRIRADFAKDLPVRQASDDAGRLAIVKAYAGDGLGQTRQVIAKANQALNEVPYENVKGIIREIIRETDQVTDLFNRALGQNSYAAAWNSVAEAVLICRIDTQPWATQAVRDAGLTGTVRIRVVDQAGQPLSGAFATVLTSHTPLGARADGSGRVTFVNVAAVPALPVKAYIDGRVYHEINMNLSPGATLDGTIALPPLPRSGVAPAVSGAAITPQEGPGNASVLFSVTATDPQGRLDLAEDQIFALNPDLGFAYVLLHVGNNRYETREALPNLSAGSATWYFFAVDHECHTSDIIPVAYRVVP